MTDIIVRYNRDGYKPTTQTLAVDSADITGFHECNRTLSIHLRSGETIGSHRPLREVVREFANAVTLDQLAATPVKIETVRGYNRDAKHPNGYNYIFRERQKTTAAVLVATI